MKNKNLYSITQLNPLMVQWIE